jgi:hypothetical protein
MRILESVSITPLLVRLFNHFCLVMFDTMSNDAQSEVFERINTYRKPIAGMSLRSTFRMVPFNSNFGAHSFLATAVKLMNNLVNSHKDSTKMEFKRFLEKEKTNILDQNKFIIFGKFLQ